MLPADRLHIKCVPGDMYKSGLAKAANGNMSYLDSLTVFILPRFSFFSGFSNTLFLSS